jgi:hypothetical protein
MVAVESLLIAAVVALNEADLAPVVTATDAGTVSVESVLARVMLKPPAGACWVKVTVQALEEFGPRVVGVQASEETDIDATRLRVVLVELPL